MIEVLSPSTRGIDLIRKVDEYKSVPTLRHIVLIEPEPAHVAVWSRTDVGQAWEMAEYTGLSDDAQLSPLGLSLSVAALYSSVGLPAADAAG